MHCVSMVIVIARNEVTKQSSVLLFLDCFIPFAMTGYGTCHFSVLKVFFHIPFAMTLQRSNTKKARKHFFGLHALFNYEFEESTLVNFELFRLLFSDV